MTTHATAASSATLSRPALAACALIAALAAACPLTAAAATGDARSVYAAERAACLRGTSNQDRATCLQEAQAALAEARRGQLQTPSAAELTDNRLRRCDAQPGADREACIARMQGGDASGSAQSGGILRETTQPVPAQ